MNKKVIVMSLVAIACLGLMFLISWWFIIPAVILMILNQRELMNKR